MQNILQDIGLIFILATLGGFLARIFRQPLIPLYILTGLIIGPVLGLITNKDLIIILSEIGIAFLLFLVGLEINFRKLREIVNISAVGGTIQTLIFGLLAYLLASNLGFSSLQSIYLALVVTFSSTTIVLKILSDKKELDTLHARIIIGILLLQDILAIIALSILHSLNNFSFYLLGATFISALLALAIAYLASRYIFPSLFRFAARSPELLLLLAISICFIIGFLFQKIGLTLAVGAFIAGASLADLEYSPEIAARMRSLRDFFATIFFVSLGLLVGQGSITGMFWPIIILSLFVIFFKPLTIMLMSAAYGYKKNVSFLSSISLGQISEFSLIIVLVGYQAGQIPATILSVTTIVAMITLIVSTYLITYSRFLAMKLAPILSIFERHTIREELHFLPKKESLTNHTIIFGCDRVGRNILETLKRLKKKVLVVDYNPEIIRTLRDNHIPCIYGDMGDLEILDSIGLNKAKMIISTVPSIDNNLLILTKVNEKNSESITYTTAQTVEEALDLYDAGSDYVIVPHILGGERVSILLEQEYGDITKILATKKEHIKELQEREQEDKDHHLHHLHNLR